MYRYYCSVFNSNPKKYISFFIKVNVNPSLVKQRNMLILRIKKWWASQLKYSGLLKD